MKQELGKKTKICVKKLLLIFVTFPVLVNCDGEVIKDDIEQFSNNESEAVCDIVTLQKQAQTFLLDLSTENVSKIALNYQGQKQSSELIKYTFFPQLNQNAIFNYSEWSRERTISSHILGDYEDGKLVVFTNKDVVTYDKLIKVEKKFEGFFACHFICEKGSWKVSSKHTCFEETGAPFQN